MSTRARSEDTEVDYRPSWDHSERVGDTQIIGINPGVRRSSTANVRHRNKPTLSCQACVNKKTKCDRLRPICHACQSRHTTCEYQSSTSNSSRNGGRSEVGTPESRRQRPNIPDTEQENNDAGQFSPIPPSNNGMITFGEDLSAHNSSTTPITGKSFAS